MFIFFLWTHSQGKLCRGTMNIDLTRENLPKRIICSKNTCIFILLKCEVSQSLVHFYSDIQAVETYTVFLLYCGHSSMEFFCLFQLIQLIGNMYFLFLFFTLDSKIDQFFRFINIIKYGCGPSNCDGPAHLHLPFWHRYHHHPRYIFYNREFVQRLAN